MTINLTEWIGTGKTFNHFSQPDSLTDAFNDAMIAPYTSLSSLFPPDVPVAKILLARKLPTQSSWPPKHIDAIDALIFFSRETPTSPLPASWTSLPLPSPRLCFALACNVGQAWLDGFTSVKHQDGGNIQFPLWAVRFWLEATLVVEARRRWEKSMQWLAKMDDGTDSNFTALCERLDTDLAAIGWAEPLLGSAELGAVNALDLTRLLSSDTWLNDRLVDGMIGQLRARISHMDDVKILSLEETFALRRPASAWESYGVKDFRVLHETGNALQTNKLVSLYLPLHVNGNHFLSVKVNSAVKGISYGCGLQRSIPPNDAKSLSRWLAYHGFPKTPPTNTLYAPQQDDTSSCGLIVINTFAVDLFLEEPWTPATKMIYRIQKALDFTQEHRQKKFNCQSTNTFPDTFMDLLRLPVYDIISNPVRDFPLRILFSSPASLPTSSPFYSAFSPLSTSASILPPDHPEISMFDAEPLPLSSSSPLPSLSFLPDHLEIPTKSSPEPLPGSSPGTSPLFVVPELPHSTPSFKKPSQPLRRNAVMIELRPTNQLSTNTNIVAGVKRKGIITDFFSCASKEERSEMVQRDFAILKENQEERRAKEAQEQRLRKERTKALATDRQRRKRARDKAFNTITDDHDITPSTHIPPIATASEMSRPKRALMRTQKSKDSKGRGRLRKEEKERVQAKVRTYWCNPLLATIIIETQKDITSIRDRWNGTEIVRQLVSKSPTLFGGLRPQVLNRYRVMTGKFDGHWKDEFVETARNHGLTPQWQRKRVPLLASYPTVSKTIVANLKAIRDAGLPVMVTTVRAVVVAVLEQSAPEILESLKCSDYWIRSFVFHQPELKWVMRKPTRSGRKIPKNAPELLLNSFYRHVLSFREALIRHACFQVNMDETQARYVMGGGLTFERCGENQVSVNGLDDKRAFTVSVALAGNGELLPFQAIYTGMTAASTPARNAIGFEEADSLGFLFDYSGTKTYWANIKTLQRWVQKILVPFWEEKKKELGLSYQECMLQIDVWSVHRSEAFKTWMTREYPWIILDFVPAGCTGIFQPCDVTFNRPLKLAIRQAQQEDLLDEARSQLAENGTDTVIEFEQGIKVIRDRSVRWLLNAYNIMNQSDVVKKAFEMCKAGEQFNLSFESITSLEAQQALREVQRNDPKRWDKIHLRKNTDDATEDDEDEEDEYEDAPFAEDDDFDDDISLPPAHLITNLAALAEGNKIDENYVVDPHDGHIRPFEDEDLEDEVINEALKDAKLSDSLIAKIQGQPTEFGRGKRKRLDLKGRWTG